MNQYELNKEIEAFVAEKQAKGEPFTDDDIQYIMQHEGKGGQGKHGASGEGLLYQFFTPMFVCKLMWELALHYGYDGGYVMEPSCATGRLFNHAPDQSKCVGFEIEPGLGRIAKIAYPKATVYYENCGHEYFKDRKAYFETAFLQPPRFTMRIPPNKLTWLPQYPFSLVIGNPPYGLYKNYYSGYFKKPKIRQIELFFFYYGLKLIKPGGLLIYLTSQNIIRRGYAYQDTKQEMEKITELVDAYRLPPVFQSSAVPTDIIVLRKK